MKTFDSGAKSSEEAPRIDLIPVASLKRQAARMAEGAASHGERNYEKGANDPTFIRDRKNHLVLHALSYLAGDESDDHLGAILANAGMLARLEELAAFQIPESVNVPFVQVPGERTSVSGLLTYTGPDGAVYTITHPTDTSFGSAVVHDVPVNPSGRTSAEILKNPPPLPVLRSYDESRAGASKCEFCDRPNLTNPKACAGGCVFAHWPVSGDRQG